VIDLVRLETPASRVYSGGNHVASTGVLEGVKANHWAVGRRSLQPIAGEEVPLSGLFSLRTVRLGFRCRICSRATPAREQILGLRDDFSVPQAR
jgi:hypothetical protein